MTAFRYIPLLIIWLWLTIIAMALFISQAGPFHFLVPTDLILLVEESKLFLVFMVLPLTYSRQRWPENAEDELAFRLAIRNSLLAILVLFLPLTLLTLYFSRVESGLLLQANLLLFGPPLLFVAVRNSGHHIYYFILMLVCGALPVLYYLLLELAGKSIGWLIMINPFWLLWQMDSPEVFRPAWLIQLLVLILVALLMRYKVTRDKRQVTGVAILVSCFLSLAAGVSGLSAETANSQGISIEEVRIGWDGYYRTGYWCPAYLVITSRSDFSGEVSLRIDRITYSTPVWIAADSLQYVAFNVLINSSRPDVEIVVSDKPGKPVLNTRPDILSLKAVMPDEFLIGVEKNIFEHFSAEFTSQSDAFKKSRLFPFVMSELPRGILFTYESVDLLVFSSPILDRALQQTLDTWQKTERGNTLFFRSGQTGISVDKLVGVKSYSANPCINPDIYRKFDHSPWHKQLKEVFYPAISIYTLISVMLILLWVVRKRLGLSVFGGVSIFLIVAAIGMIYISLPRNTTQGELIDYQSEQFLMISNQFGDKAQATVISGGKPLYRDAERLTQTNIYFRFGVPPYRHTLIEVGGSRPVVFYTKTFGYRHLYPDDLQLLTIKR